MKGLNLIELIVVIAIITILALPLIPMLAGQLDKTILDAAAMQFLMDLRQAQQLSLSRENGYSYYGIRLYNNLGLSNNQIGYKIERYEPAGITPPIAASSTITTVKSPASSDNPIIFDERLAFNNRISFASSTELNNGNRIIFNPDGSTTTDG